MSIYKFGNNTYPWCIRHRLNLGHIFREKKCVLWAGKYGKASSNSSSSSSSSSNDPRSVVNTEISINVLYYFSVFPNLMFNFNNIIVKLLPFKISLSLVFKFTVLQINLEWQFQYTFLLISHNRSFVNPMDQGHCTDHEEHS